MKRFICMVLFSSMLFAGSYEDGLEAYKKQDYKNAIFYFDIASEMNDGGFYGNHYTGIPEYYLGMMYYNGLGTKKDNEKAFSWFFKSAYKGHKDAQYNLGLMYFNRYTDFSTNYESILDYKRAKESFEKAAIQGHIDAQHNLGIMYYNGFGTKRDYMKAKEWYEKAAIQGHINAQNNLGTMYFDGLGVRQDYTKAKEWFEKSAKQGNINAQHNLGDMYYDGQGIKQDYKKAKEWHGKAKEWYGKICDDGDQIACDKYKLLNTKRY